MVHTYELEPKEVDTHKSFYGKAVVVADEENNTRTLYSYGTRVAEDDNTPGAERFSVTRNEYNLTTTTLRHLREFIAQRTGQICVTKKMILDGAFDPLV